MKYFVLLLLYCLTGIRQTLAACANPTAVANYNEQAFLGVWFYAGVMNQPSYSCMKMNFSAGTGLLNYEYTTASGKKSTTTSGTWTPVTGSSGKYTDKFPSTATTSIVVTVVATDYLSYAVVYRCITVGTSTIDIYELLSRTTKSFSAARNSAGTAIPSSVVFNAVNNFCPTGTITDIFPFAKG